MGGYYIGIGQMALDTAAKNLAARGIAMNSPGYGREFFDETDRIAGFCEPRGGSATASALIKQLLEAGKFNSPDQNAELWMLDVWRSAWPPKLPCQLYSENFLH